MAIIEEDVEQGKPKQVRCGWFEPDHLLEDRQPLAWSGYQPGQHCKVNHKAGEENRNSEP
jgi:hypothetical protein